MTEMLAAASLLIHTADERGVHTLTLNQPGAFNVLSDTVLDLLLSSVDRIASDTCARAVVIGATGQAFCAGHNLKEMAAHPDLAYYQTLFAKCTRFMLALQNLPVPVIAKVQGLATAAGCQLVAQCDLAVASDQATFGVNGIDVGLFCATPSVALVRNMPVKQALEMLLTGCFINADEAKQRGLVNRVVPAEALEAGVEALLLSILSKPASAVALGKALFYKQQGIGIEAAYQLASQAMAINMMLPAAQEGVHAFIEKRKPQWPTAAL